MNKAPYGHRYGHFKFGNAEVRRVGGRGWDWNDVYHWLLSTSWSKFGLIMASLYILTNLTFASLYMLEPGSVMNARPDSFLDHFFFSVETFATVGYGIMAPATHYSHVIATVEILTGIGEIAVVAGMVFARFARPSTRILFSDVAVVCKFNGVPTLMIRAGNERNNLILEADVRAAIVKRERTIEGQEFTRFYELKLEREHTSVFALSWTVMHKIDESSPLYGLDADELLDEHAALSVSMSGTDDTFNDFVHARHTYTPDKIKWGYRFVDILSEPANGRRLIDFDKFHDIIIDVAPHAH